MENEILFLERKWSQEDKINSNKISPVELLEFEVSNQKLIPATLREYFSQLNGTNGYDEDFFCFNSFNNFKKISVNLVHYKGQPKYKI